MKALKVLMKLKINTENSVKYIVITRTWTWTVTLPRAEFQYRKRIWWYKYKIYISLNAGKQVHWTTYLLKFSRIHTFMPKYCHNSYIPSLFQLFTLQFSLTLQIYLWLLHFLNFFFNQINELKSFDKMKIQLSL